MIEVGETVLLKTDGMGRAKTPAGIKYQMFATWAQKRRQQPVAGGGGGEAQNSRRKNPTGIVLQLPGGVRVDVG